MGSSVVSFETTYLSQYYILEARPSIGTPTLYEAILVGNYSPLLTVSGLMKDLSLGWDEQRLVQQRQFG